MTIIATAVRHLMAAGVTGEALVAAIADMEAAQPKDAAAERRRAWDRERKRAAKSGGIPVESAETAECGKSPPLSPQTPLSPPEIIKPARVKGHRLPANWQPQPLTGDLAQAVALWPSGAIERELARFRDWAASATGPNAIKLDWQAAWRNWVRKCEDEGRYPRRDGQAKPGDPLVASILARQAVNERIQA